MPRLVVRSLQCHQPHLSGQAMVTYHLPGTQGQAMFHRLVEIGLGPYPSHLGLCNLGVC